MASVPPSTAPVRRLFAQFLGTGQLVAIVVGSGIAAHRLSPDGVSLELSENSTATVFGLTVVILMLGRVWARMSTRSCRWPTGFSAAAPATG